VLVVVEIPMSPGKGGKRANFFLFFPASAWTATVVVVLFLNSSSVNVSLATSTLFAVEVLPPSLLLLLLLLLLLTRAAWCSCSSRRRFSAAWMAAERAAVADVLPEGPRRRDGAIVTNALQLCDAAQLTQAFDYFCSSDVFSQRISTARKNHGKRDLMS
jgi:hypothetical protein